MTSKTLALAAATFAFGALPAAALADGHGHSSSSPAQQCRQEQKTMGKTAFEKTYGTHHNGRDAFGKCVSHRTRQDSTDSKQAQTSAEKTCRAEQSDSSFSSSHNGKTFDQFYGTNKNGKNAFGKCVSDQAKSTSTTEQTVQVTSEDNAAKSCRTEQSKDPAAFAKKYGTNGNDANAFGKCVSTTAKQQEDQSSSTSGGSDSGSSSQSSSTGAPDSGAGQGSGNSGSNSSSNANSHSHHHTM